MKSIKFRGCNIAFYETGQGEPILFLHNGGNDHRIWEHQIAHFSKTNRVIADDHIGYGESDKPDLEYTLPLFTEMVGTIVEELKLAPVTLIGHCIGGAMAINFAKEHPEKVKKVVAFNVATEKTLLAGPLAEAYLGFSQSREALNQFCAAIEAQKMPREETDKGLFQQYGETPPNDAEFAGYIYDLYNRPGQMRSLYNNLANFASFAALDNFVKPAGFPPLLLIWGGANQILPAEAGAELRLRLQPERSEFIAGCGHLVMRERPEQINRMIEEFMHDQTTTLQTAAN
jgi:pimeloyl-ACP methyl ester carboxylesterase